MASEWEDYAKIFKAFSDGNRLQILSLLQDGERCICHILENLNIQQSTLSHHMMILSDARIVKGRKDGKWTHYSIDPEGSRRAQELLGEILAIKGTEMDCSCK